MATDFLAIELATNDNGEVTTEIAYYPIPADLTCAQADAFWHNDPVAISKEIKTVVIPAGMILQLDDCGIITISEVYVERYPDGSGNVSTFLSAAPGKNLRVVYLNSAGTAFVRPTESRGYVSAAFQGSKPYGALHASLPNGSYTLRVLGPDDTILFEQTVVLTDNLPLGRILPGELPTTPTMPTSSTSTAEGFYGGTATAITGGTDFAGRAMETQLAALGTGTTATAPPPPSPPPSPPAAATAHNIPATRWIGPELFNEFRAGDSFGQPYLDAAFDAGANCAQIWCEWKQVRQADGSLDWTQFDANMNYVCVTKNVPVMVRITLTGDWNNPGKIPWTDAGHMMDNYGKRMHDGGNACFSFNHEPTLVLVEGFVTAVCNHINANAAWSSQVLSISIANSPLSETNYPTSNYPVEGTNSGLRDVEFDWNPASITAYQNRLKSWFSNDLSAYNALFSPTVTDWTQILPPTPANAAPPQGYPFRQGVLWYAHRHYSLQEYIARMVAAIHAVNPGWETMTEFSSVDLGFNNMMATRGCGTLVPATCNGIKLNDDKDSDHFRTTSLALRDRRAAYWSATECALNTQSVAENVDHGTKFFAAGGNVFLLFGLAPGPVSAVTDVITQVKASVNGVLAPATFTRPAVANPGAPVVLPLRTAIDKSYTDSALIGEYNAQAAIVNGKSTKPVLVTLSDNLLTALTN